MDNKPSIDNLGPRPPQGEKKGFIAKILKRDSGPPPAEKKLTDSEVLIRAASINREVRRTLLDGKYDPSVVENAGLSDDWKSFFGHLVNVMRTDMEATQKIVGVAEQRIALVEASQEVSDSLAGEIYKMAFVGRGVKWQPKGEIELIHRPSVSLLIIRDWEDFKKTGIGKEPVGEGSKKEQGTYLDRHTFSIGSGETVSAPLIVVYSRDKSIAELETVTSEELLHHTHRHTQLAAAKSEGRHTPEEDGIATTSIKLGLDLNSFISRVNREGVTGEIKSLFEKLLGECSLLADSYASSELFANIANSDMAKLKISSELDRVNTLTGGMDIELSDDRSVYNPWSVVFPDIDRLPEPLQQMVNERKSKYAETVISAVDSAEDGFLSMLFFEPEFETAEAYYFLLQRYPLSEWDSRLGTLMGENLELYRQHLKDLDPIKHQCLILREQALAQKRGEELPEHLSRKTARFGQNKELYSKLTGKIIVNLKGGKSAKDAIKAVKDQVDRLRTALSK